MLRVFVMLLVCGGLTGCEFVAGVEDRSLAEAGAGAGAGSGGGEACPNLLLGGDFEGWDPPAPPPPHWHVLDGTASRSDDAASGNYSLHAEGEGGAPAWRIHTDALALEPGSYVFSAWVRYVSGHTQPPLVEVNEAPFPHATVPWHPNGGWEEISVALTYTGAPASNSILLGAAPGSSSAQAVRLDDLRLVRTDCAP